MLIYSVKKINYRMLLNTVHRLNFGLSENKKNLMWFKYIDKYIEIIF